MSEVEPLIGRSYLFEDGSMIQIIQVKYRENVPWVTYHTSINSSLPRKLVMTEQEFLDNFGHLFGVRNNGI